jgi:hypothetical protein
MQPISQQDIIDKYTVFKKKISALLVLSAALMLLASPLLLFNLLQPVQAQTTPLIFRTREPARSDNDGCVDSDATLTFDAQGTPSSSSPQRLDITSGTFKVTSIRDAGNSYSGNINGGSFTNNSGGGGERIGLIGIIDNVSNTTNCSIEGATFSIGAPYSTLNDGAPNPVTISTHYTVENSYPIFNNFNGVVECSSQGGGDTTQSSSSMTGSSQDGDGDGIPNANDNCPNLPHTRCYKEVDTALVVHSNR